MTHRIPPRSGVAFTLEQGAELVVLDPEGGQVSDLLAFDLGDPREVLSNGRTFDYEETTQLTTGNTLPAIALPLKLLDLLKAGGIYPLLEREGYIATRAQPGA